MHLLVSSHPAESYFSARSDNFERFPISSESHELWPANTLAMAEQLYADQFGRLSAPSQDWTPASAVSSFNLPLIYDSTLTTPVSIHPESLHPHGKPLNDAQWARNRPRPVQYQSRGSEGPYVNANSMSTKSKNESLTIPGSEADSMLSISPYVFESPATPCPPTPYWGSFGVSAPPTSSSSTSAATPSSASHSNMSVQSRGSSQAPILMAPNPTRRPRQRANEDGVLHKQHQQVQIQMKMQAQQHQQQQLQQQQVQQQQQLQQQQRTQSPHTHIKRECPSPSPKPKRRRRSAPPVEVHKTVSKEDLSEEDKLLLHLREIKEGEKWDWKELTERFNMETGGKHNLAALQMRHTRLVERMRIWTEVEIRALKRAKVQFDNQKWKNIAEGMLDYGCETKWSPHACQVKWQELHPNDGEPENIVSTPWSDNNTTVSTPQRNDSMTSMVHDEEHLADVSEGNPYAQNSVETKQRGAGKGNSRGPRSIYEQRQEWSVIPQ